MELSVVSSAGDASEEAGGGVGSFTEKSLASASRSRAATLSETEAADEDDEGKTADEGDEGDETADEDNDDEEIGSEETPE